MSKTATEFVKETTLLYGMYTIENRALPDFRDGLKPSHRRLLWGMYRANFTSSGNFRKSARTLGETMGKYHPHGSQGLYSAMQTLVNANEPLIEGSGSWGSYVGEPAAAERYTEARLSKFAEQNLLDPVYLRCVPIVPNYDGEFEEPVYLPAKLPVLLINGSEGIATGCSNLIPSFSTDSVVALTKLALKKKITAQDCFNTLEFSFPYGGVEVNDDDDLLNFYKTGNQSLLFMPDYELNKNVLVFTTTAPRFNIENVLSAIAELKEVKAVDDFSEGESIRFQVEFRAKGEPSEELVETIEDIATTRLNCQTLITIRDKSGEHAEFKRTTIPVIINSWIKWRIQLEQLVIKELIRVEQEKLERQELLELAVLNRKLIIEALDKPDPAKYLTSSLKIDLARANRILDLKVRMLAKLELAPIRTKIKEIKTTISVLKKDGSTEANVKQRILKQLG